MSRLPGSEEAWVEDSKILDYLLNGDHAIGQSKARFFQAHGFSRARWRDFAEALKRHARRNEVVDVRTTAFGMLYEVRCTLQTPGARDPCIRTVWQVAEDGRPRLITAYPLA